MNLKRTSKSLAVRAASSKLGSNRLISKTILKGVKIDYEPPGGVALSCVSIDFDVTNPARFEANRKGTLALLEVAERHNIPITWAICGDAAVRDMKSFNAILNSSHDHEIAVHTYSHLDATATTKGDFRSDVRQCITSLGLESPRSFVFPWNREAHFDVLREFGFRAFRGAQRAIGPPVMQEGLWNVRPVYYVDQKSEGAGKLMEEYLELCVRRGGVFHLWSHPWALVIDGSTSSMAQTMESIFQSMDALKDKSRLIASTMGGIAYVMETNSGKAVPLAVP
jgi:peptidoglycan/xylan/chitin deacetylase (PgdA/CDA1 family)